MTTNNCPIEAYLTDCFASTKETSYCPSLHPGCTGCCIIFLLHFLLYSCDDPLAFLVDARSLFQSED